MRIVRTLALALLLSSSLSMLAETPMEKEYKRLAERFEYKEKSLVRDLRDYLARYPYSTYEDEVHYMIGAIQMENGRYKQALKELDRADYTALAREHQPHCVFYKGYGHLMQQEYDKALTPFGVLRRSENPYRVKATYYSAYCLYKLERFDDALPILEEIENKAEYRETVPYYLVQIYYSKKQYEQVAQRAEKLLQEQPNNTNNAELHRMLGEIYFQQGAYAQAVEQFGLYTKGGDKTLVRNDLYLLGQAEYHLGHYDAAIQAFKQVKQQADTISEAACLAMGHAQRAMGRTEQAKLSYQAAMNYNITPRLHEEAMYNYTLSTYESSTALGESVQAFTAFLERYPNSEHTRTIYLLMGDALRKSKNYAAALDALNAITDPDAKMLESKQVLRFKIGTDAFLQGKMKDAKRWMDEVIAHADARSTEISTEARYWRAEASYRLREYEAANADLTAFMSDPLSRRSSNYNMAIYLRAYTYFSLKNYGEAEKTFRQYVHLTADQDPTYADALNRLGDCSFNNRRFEEAIRNYSEVIDLHATGSDYATFQKGYAEGLLRRHDRKIATLQSLVVDYPKSDYADDALYEIARAQLSRDNEAGAIEAYEQLLAKYPHSNKARTSSLEVAMMYRNMHQYDKAIEAYKNTIKTYPASEEAYAALSGLEDTYVETNNISDYLAYTKQLGKLNMKVATKDDSLSYAAAELQYMLGNYTEAAAALTTYLSSYCAGGRYCTAAQYYAADCYYRLGQRSEALEAYRSLAGITGNPYMEEACTHVAELSYDNADYRTALEYFRRLLSISTSTGKADAARLGILRSSYYIGDHTATIDIATDILAGEKVNESVREEALYSRARALIAQHKYGQAVVDLTPLAEEVRTRQGAESKYLLAECYYQMGALDNAEQEIMSFAGMNTQQQYWLAKALILLSDINLSRGENFQARQYLLSLQANYKQQDDIQSIVAERLAAMDAQEIENVEPTEQTEE